VKIALVTGASRGIGLAVADALRAAPGKGMHVVRLARTLRDASAEGRTDIACDITRPADVDRMVEEVVSQWGAIDILVNNAGTNPVMGPLMDMDPAAWDKIMDVNLKGPYLASVRVARAMVERGEGGKIINISSGASLDPAPMLGAYSISKAALNHLTRVLAKECGHAKICVNAIAPGLIETAFAAALIQNPAIHQGVVRQTPLGRHGQPDEIVGSDEVRGVDAARFHVLAVVVVHVVVDGQQ